MTTETQISLSTARTATDQTVRGGGRERIAVEITRAPDRVDGNARAQAGREVRQAPEVQRPQETRENQRPQERVLRARPESVSPEGRVVLPTAEGEFELQITDPRAVQQLRAEIAQRVAEIELILPPASTPQNGGTSANIASAAEIVILPPPDVARSGADTPVQVQISGQEIAAAEAALPVLDLAAGAALPNQPIRLESVLLQDVQPFLTPSAPIVDIVGQAVTATAPETVVNIQPAADFSRLPPLFNITPPAAAAVNILDLTIPFAGQIVFSSPVPDVFQSLLPFAPDAPQLAASTNLPFAPPQGAIVAAPVNQPESPLAQSAYIRLDTAQTPPPFSDLPPENLILNNAPAASSTGVIVGQTPEGLPIITLNAAPESLAQTDAFFVLHRPATNLILGTEISFVPLSSASEAEILTSSIQAGLTPQTALTTPAPWPALTEALQQSTASVAQVLSNITPSPAIPAQVTPAALFFLAAVGAGDVSHWLGQRHIETLRRAGQSRLAERVGQDLQGLSRLSSEPVSQDWRAMALPLLWQDEIHKAVIHYKREEYGEGQDEQAAGGKQTRFVFDLNLDGMGDVQLDALFRPGRLDTILRTEERFSEAMHGEMRRMYTDALKLSEMGGELSFQNEAEQWVKILPKSRDLGVRV